MFHTGYDFGMMGWDEASNLSGEDGIALLNYSIFITHTKIIQIETGNTFKINSIQLKIIITNYEIIFNLLYSRLSNHIWILLNHRLLI